MRACAAAVAARPRTYARRGRTQRVVKPTRRIVIPRVADDSPVGNTENNENPTPKFEYNRNHEAPSSSSSPSRSYRFPEEYAADGNGYVAKHFVNLKNGIEAVPELRGLDLEVNFLRVQSTLCEVGDMEKVILELDASFLLAAALGYSCLVYDYGSRDKKRGTPRAIWYGLEFIRYALNKTWFGKSDRLPILRGKQVESLFSGKLSSMSKSTKKKLKYYRKFLPPEVLALDNPAVRLVGVFKVTKHDDDEKFYADLVREQCAPETANKKTNPINANQTVITERKCVDALTALGFKVYYGGDADEEWIDQVRER